MKEFKKGDTVYYGTLKGEVTEQLNDTSNSSMTVYFEKYGYTILTKDGRYFKDTPVVLSHFPYELQMKKVELVIEKDTVVWFRDNENQSWRVGYYSHYEDDEHYVFSFSKKSTESKVYDTWKIVTTENPLK